MKNIIKIIALVLVLIVVGFIIKTKFFNPLERDVTILGQKSNKLGKKKKIIFAGPFATVSHPLIHMIKSNALKDIASQVEFRLWKNPDELRAIALKGEVDFVAVPTNVAANLYNKGVKIKLLNVSIWGILGMVSRDKNLKKLKDFKGKEIVVPFRADMPDIVLRALLKKQGFNVEKDFKLLYLSSPIDAMQMLITRRADHVLLAEPATSMALRKTKSFPIKIVAPTLFRSTDLQVEWGESFHRSKKIPQAGIALLGNKGKKFVTRFLEEYGKAVKWYKKNPERASLEVAQVLPMLEAKAISDSIKFVQIKNVIASRAKKELEFFYNVLIDDSPKIIGSKLPDKEFYY